MFKTKLQKVDAFNELAGCAGTYTLIDKDGEITFTTCTNSHAMPTYKDKETYHIRLQKPNKEWGCFDCVETVISAGYDEDTNNKRIKGLSEFMDSVKGSLYDFIEPKVNF